MMAAACVGAQTATASLPWKVTSTATIVAPSTASVGSTITLSVNAGSIDLTGARITWEAQGQQPAFGTTFSVKPTTAGSNWAEVEITWPDGRRMFGATTYNVQ